jgi:GNAT superfamily N-acetyltransferase
MPPDLRNVFSYGSWTLQKVLDDLVYQSFDCDNSDLNDYYHNEISQYKEQLATQTYCLQSSEYPGIVFALLDLCNDAVHFDKYKEIVKIGNIRHHPIPAVKLTRLGVQKEYWGNNIGTNALNIVKRIFITDNRTGCRLITVDAYADKVGFYEKNGFLYFWDKDKNKSNRSMYFDLKRLLVE